MQDGTDNRANTGTPQGGVISPVLANLFLHYVFDKWMDRNHPDNPWARYADDAVAHCRSKEEAEELLEQLQRAFSECELELHPDKTRIVYCKDDDRQGRLSRKSNLTFWDIPFDPGDPRIDTGSSSSISLRQSATRPARPCGKPSRVGGCI